MSMREKIARAICAPILWEFDGHPLRETPAWEQQSEKDRQKLLAIADAVLDAMRDPTDGMHKVGVEKDEELEWLQPDRAVTQIWEAMIDAAKDGK